MMGIINIVGLFVLMLVSLCSCQNSDFGKRLAVEQETPHVIREFDGCKVYRFIADDKYHYFTRCGDSVSTERNYTEYCGKACIRQESETVVTKGNQ